MLLIPTFGLWKGVKDPNWVEAIEHYLEKTILFDPSSPRIIRDGI
jgi:hypothetical protein